MSPRLGDRKLRHCFLIGTLSEKAGVNIDTIRYYERIGLLAPYRRSSGRHRLVSFVRHGRELGFSLKAMGRFLRSVIPVRHTAPPNRSPTGILLRFDESLRVSKKLSERSRL